MLDEGKVEDWMQIHVFRFIDVKIQIRSNLIYEINLRLLNACVSVS